MKVVCVLKLIHQDVGEAFSVALGNFWVTEEEEIGLQQQVIEVHGICLSESSFVDGIDLRCFRDVLVGVSSLYALVVGIHLRGDAFSFCPTDA